ncbi:MAG: serine hydrolase [Lachnospiraceae bacterium]|nr:serine hydrolase [Lachnospiraceae bacterium]
MKTGKRTEKRAWKLLFVTLVMAALLSLAFGSGASFAAEGTSGSGSSRLATETPAVISDDVSAGTTTDSSAGTAADSSAGTTADSGKQLLNGFVTESDGYTYYYVNSVKKGGWVTIGKKTYYFYKSAHGSTPAKAMVTDAVIKIGDYRYYFDEEGVMQTGWVTWNKKTYYFYKSAHDPIPKGAAAIGLVKINNERYYFSSTGKMQTGWQTINGSTYYFKKTASSTVPKGAALTGLWKISSNRYYFSATGKMKTGWQTIDGSKYYFKKKASSTVSKGAALTGLWKISGSRYYFSSAGKMLTGWQTVSGDTYYFGSDGKAQTGWQTIGSNKYCFASDGKMLTDCWKDGYYLLSDGTIAKNQQVPDGYYVDANGKKIELSGIKSTITSMISSYGGTWSVYVKNLESGDVLNINDCAMYPASTIKVFVMASLYNEIAAGRIAETSQITSLLNSMITVSSNEAYNELVRRQSSSGSSFLSGAAVVNNYLKANGYTSTGVHHTLHPASSSSTSDGSRNVSSAKDCGVLLENIYNGTCVSKAYSQKMLNLLLAQERRWKIPAGVPSGIKVANKTGETSTTQHDIAIVYGEKTDYVICVFSSGCSEYTGINGIKNISRTIYNYLN